MALPIDIYRLVLMYEGPQNMIKIFNTDSGGTYGETYPDSGTSNRNRNCVVTGTGIGVGWLSGFVMGLWHFQLTYID